MTVVTSYTKAATDTLLTGKVGTSDSRLTDARAATDASVTALVNNGASATRAALGTAFDARYVTQTSYGLVLTPSGGDDTASIHAARDAAGVGGRLIFGPGIFSTAGLTPSVSGQVWDLHPAATIKLAAGSNADVVNVTGAGVRVVGDGVIDGNKTMQTANGRGIRVAASGVRIRDLTVTNTRLSSVHNYGGSRFRVQNVTSVGADYIGIFSESNGAPYVDVRVEGCEVDRTHLAAAAIVEGGLKIKGNSAAHLLTRGRVTDCVVLMPVSPTDGSAIAIETTFAPGAVVCGNRTEGGAMGVSAAACDRAAVSDNTVFNPSTYGIEGAGSRGATFTGNTVNGNGLTQYGIFLTQGGGVSSDGATINANTIVGCTTMSINVQSAVRVAVTGNTAESTSGGSYLLNLTLADYATVSGNTLDGHGAASKAIMVESTSFAAVSGNTLKDCTQNGVFLYSGTGGYVIQSIAVTGNTVTGIPATIDAVVANGATVGGGIRVMNNPGMFDYPDFATRVTAIVGAGSPEGAWYAGRGSTYLRTDGGAGTTLYVKESAVSLNTGWAAK